MTNMTYFCWIISEYLSHTRAHWNPKNCHVTLNVKIINVWSLSHAEEDRLLLWQPLSCWTCKAQCSIIVSFEHIFNGESLAFFMERAKAANHKIMQPSLNTLLLGHFYGHQDRKPHSFSCNTLASDPTPKEELTDALDMLKR